MVMEKIIGYVYSIESNYVIAEVSGSQKNVEKYVEENYDNQSCGFTYSPAFGFSDGLIDVVDSEKDFIDADEKLSE